MQPISRSTSLESVSVREASSQDDFFPSSIESDAYLQERIQALVGQVNFESLDQQWLTQEGNVSCSTYPWEVATSRPVSITPLSAQPLADALRELGKSTCYPNIEQLAHELASWCGNNSGLEGGAPIYFASLWGSFLEDRADLGWPAWLVLAKQKLQNLLYIHDDKVERLADNLLVGEAVLIEAGVQYQDAGHALLLQVIRLAEEATWQIDIYNSGSGLADAYAQTSKNDREAFHRVNSYQGRLDAASWHELISYLRFYNQMEIQDDTAASLVHSLLTTRFGFEPIVPQDFDFAREQPAGFCAAYCFHVFLREEALRYASKHNVPAEIAIVSYKLVRYLYRRHLLLSFLKQQTLPDYALDVDGIRWVVQHGAENLGRTRTRLLGSDVLDAKIKPILEKDVSWLAELVGTCQRIKSTSRDLLTSRKRSRLAFEQETSLVHLEDRHQFSAEFCCHTGVLQVARRALSPESLASEIPLSDSRLLQPDSAVSALASCMIYLQQIDASHWQQARLLLPKIGPELDLKRAYSLLLSLFTSKQPFHPDRAALMLAVFARCLHVAGSELAALCQQELLALVTTCYTSWRSSRGNGRPDSLSQADQELICQAAAIPASNAGLVTIPRFSLHIPLWKPEAVIEIPSAQFCIPLDAELTFEVLMHLDMMYVFALFASHLATGAEKAKQVRWALDNRAAYTQPSVYGDLQPQLLNVLRSRMFSIKPEILPQNASLELGDWTSAVMQANVYQPANQSIKSFRWIHDNPICRQEAKAFRA